MKRIKSSIEDEQWQQLDDLSKYLERPKTWIIKMALRQYLSVSYIPPHLREKNKTN